MKNVKKLFKTSTVLDTPLVAAAEEAEAAPEAPWYMELMPVDLKAKIRKITPPSAVEYSIAIAYACAAIPFLAEDTAWYVHPLLSSTAYSLLNFMLRIPEEMVREYFGREWRLNLRFLRSVVFAIIDYNTRHPLVHEGGHAAAADSLFDHADVSITMYPHFAYIDATTSYNNTYLSTAGERIGRSNSYEVVAAAGLSATLAWNCVSLIAAQVLPDKYPEIKSHLRWSVAMNILVDFVAGMATVGGYECTDSTDYCVLDQHGFPTAAAATTIVGVVLLLQGLLFALGRYYRHHENVDAAPAAAPALAQESKTEETQPAVVEQASNRLAGFFRYLMYKPVQKTEALLAADEGLIEMREIIVGTTVRRTQKPV